MLGHRGLSSLWDWMRYYSLRELYDMSVIFSRKNRIKPQFWTLKKYERVRCRACICAQTQLEIKRDVCGARSLRRRAGPPRAAEWQLCTETCRAHTSQGQNWTDFLSKWFKLVEWFIFGSRDYSLALSSHVTVQLNCSWTVISIINFIINLYPNVLKTQSKYFNLHIKS